MNKSKFDMNSHSKHCGNDILDELYDTETDIKNAVR
jgi:hypothetical protein